MQADATIFDYDGHFDGFQDSRKQKVKSQDEERVERKSRYIESLMAKQKERDREQDIIYERRLLKERVKEDHLYGDKDKFVTASYRKKLEEDRKWLEEEKITDAKEAAEDVAKKGDLSGFYHNLMSRNTAAGAVADKGRAAPEPPKEDEAALAKKLEQERRDAEGAKRRAAYEQLKALEEAEAKKIEEDANRRADPTAPEKRHKPSGPPGRRAGDPAAPGGGGGGGEGRGGEGKGGGCRGGGTFEADAPGAAQGQGGRRQGSVPGAQEGCRRGALITVSLCVIQVFKRTSG